MSGADLNSIARRSREMGLSFRVMSDNDLPFLEDLYASTREDELALAPWSDAEKQEFIKMQFHAQHTHYQKHYPDALWLVIELADKLIGRLYLERWKSEHRIIDIAIITKKRGQGLGKAVLLDLMDEAAEVDKAIGIHVEKNNQAMELYHRLGFKTIEDKGVYDLLKWQKGNQPNTAS
ncbi:MAG: GNAT family N-acetyltransferase [Emcibacter sp.]|nr:GNAT family N-acetyltransferase [Emcibacter sp.]